MTNNTGSIYFISPPDLQVPLAGESPVEIHRYSGNFLAALNLADKWFKKQDYFYLNTSGSTGKPKKIRFTRDEIIASAETTANYFGIREGETALMCLNATYVAGFMMVMRALVNKWNLCITEPASNPLETIKQPPELAFAAFVPLQMEKILSRPASGDIEILNNMKAIIIGGGPVSQGLEDKCKTLKTPVFHTYGMTETLTHVAVRKLNGGDDSKHYYNPLPGCSLKTDEIGRLIIHECHGRIINLLTNDLAEMKADGSFSFVGRADNVINSGGHKIIPEKVQHSIHKAWKIIAPEEEVPEIIVCGLPDDKLGEKAVALLEMPGKLPEDFREKLKLQLKGLIHPYEIPRVFLPLPAFAYSSNKKVDRQKTLKKLNHFPEL